MHSSTAFLFGHSEVELDVLTLLLVSPLSQTEPDDGTVLDEEVLEDYHEKDEAVDGNYPDHPVANYEVLLNTNHVKYDEVVCDNQSDYLAEGVYAPLSWDTL